VIIHISYQWLLFNLEALSAVTTERSEAETSVASDPDYRATGRVNLLHLVFANNEDDEDDLRYDECQLNCKRAEPKLQTFHVPAVEVHCVDRMTTYLPWV
jgi:hypothetical protein